MPPTYLFQKSCSCNPCLGGLAHCMTSCTWAAVSLGCRVQAQMAGWGGFFFSLLNYKTEKYVIAENRRIGILFRLYQLAVLGYIIGWDPLHDPPPLIESMESRHWEWITKLKIGRACGRVLLLVLKQHRRFVLSLQEQFVLWRVILFCEVIDDVCHFSCNDDWCNLLSNRKTEQVLHDG